MQQTMKNVIAGLIRQLEDQGSHPETVSNYRIICNSIIRFVTSAMGIVKFFFLRIFWISISEKWNGAIKMEMSQKDIYVLKKEWYGCWESMPGWERRIPP